jgi:hypothetical protein
MGFYTVIYLGIYMEVPNGVRKVKEYTYIDNETGSQTPHKFSPNNGQKNREIVNERTEEIDPHPSELCNGKYEDDFTSYEYCGASEGFETWLPRNSKYGKEIDLDDGLTNLEVLSFDPQDKINNFVNENKEFIDATEKEYPGTRVKYGVAMVAN